MGVAFLDGRRARTVSAFLRRLDPRERAASRDRRLALPGLVDAVASALASGLSVQLAFAEVAPTVPHSLAKPTARAAAALALGAPVDDALRAYSGVIADEDLAPFGIVLGAFTRSGGRIGRSLGRVGVLLRGRIALDDERNALTAQGRASAIVLIALAPLGGLFFAVMTPEYVAVLGDRGRWIVPVAGALEIAGGRWHRRPPARRSAGAAVADPHAFPARFLCPASPALRVSRTTAAVAGWLIGVKK